MGNTQLISSQVLGQAAGIPDFDAIGKDHARLLWQD